MATGFPAEAACLIILMFNPCRAPGVPLGSIRKTGNLVPEAVRPCTTASYFRCAASGIKGYSQASCRFSSQSVERAFGPCVVTPEHVGVDLRRAHIVMPEQFLNGADIRTAGEQLGGE